MQARGTRKDREQARERESRAKAASAMQRHWRGTGRRGLETQPVHGAAQTVVVGELLDGAWALNERAKWGQSESERKTAANHTQAHPPTEAGNHGALVVDVEVGGLFHVCNRRLLQSTP